MILCEVLISDLSAEGRVCRRLVEFLMFNSIHWNKSDSACAENRVRRHLVEFVVFNSIHQIIHVQTEGVKRVVCPPQI